MFLSHDLSLAKEKKMFCFVFFQLMFTFASRQVLKDYSRADYDWSHMIAWIGVGFALISSILFSCAAICLRREREKEEAVNMQYLMPGADIQMSLSFLFPLDGHHRPILQSNRRLVWLPRETERKRPSRFLSRSCHHPIRCFPVTQFPLSSLWTWKAANVSFLLKKKAGHGTRPVN